MFCLDTFHYIRSKWALAGELRRVVDRDGIWLFAHLHNRLAWNPSPGIPLDEEGYRRVLDFPWARLLSERALLRSLMERGGRVDPVAEVSDSAVPPAFSLVAGRTSDCAGLSNTFFRLQAPDLLPQLRPNPIYRATHVDGDVIFGLDWPNPELRHECEALEQYLPAAFTLPSGTWGRMESGALTVADLDTLVPLIERLAVLPLPRAYRDSGGDGGAARRR
jgi:hypothetical protein